MSLLRQYGHAVCPECSTRFLRSHASQAFCCGEHQRAFHNRSSMRGRVAIPLMLAMRKGKRGRTEDSAYAFGEIAALADKWNAEDKAAGRSVGIVVTTKRLRGWRATDLG